MFDWPMCHQTKRLIIYSYFIFTSPRLEIFMMSYSLIFLFNCIFFFRMTAYFNQTGWPAKAPKTDDKRKEFIASLHKRKTELFMALIEKKLLPLRPGVQRSIFATTY
jgi:hypothetical protein